MTFTKQDIEKAREMIPLVQLVEQDQTIYPSGHEWKTNCPFHSDSKPSLHVNERRYHCFVCHAHGDQISWLIRQRGMNFPEAVKYLLGDKIAPYVSPELEGRVAHMDVADEPEKRAGRCRKLLPLRLLVLALVYERLGSYATLVHLSPITPPKQTEVEFLQEQLGFSKSFLGEMQALRYWEDLCAKYWGTDWTQRVK